MPEGIVVARFWQKSEMLLAVDEKVGSRDALSGKIQEVTASPVWVWIGCIVSAPQSTSRE
jgi:hypothetical protein